QERRQHVCRSVEQGIVIKGNIGDPKGEQAFQLRDRSINRITAEGRGNLRHRTIRAAKRAADGQFQDSDFESLIKATARQTIAGSSGKKLRQWPEPRAFDD